MKKILSLLLVLATLLSLCGCVPQEPVTNPETSQIQLLETQPSVPVTEQAQTEQTSPTELTDAITEATPQESYEAALKEQEATRPTSAPSKPSTGTSKPKPKPTESATQPTEQETKPTEQTSALDPNGSYDSKEEVALYIHLYGKLPKNYITKSQARKLGWKSGSVEKYAAGKCIGGDRFMNREGLLPQGHFYRECDIDTLGASSRGAKRIVFSDDGLVYYTGNHYASFTLLYGEP